MPIELTKGNLLEASVEALVNPVNCAGAMGKGLALQFKKAFPKNFEAYKDACERGELTPGRMLVVELESESQPRYILNFPTKNHWRGKSKLEDIESGLVALCKELESETIRSVAIPPLGCGLGGLEWDNVRPLIEQALEGFSEVKVLLYQPV